LWSWFSCPIAIASCLIIASCLFLSFSSLFARAHSKMSNTGEGEGEGWWRGDDDAEDTASAS